MAQPTIKSDLYMCIVNPRCACTARVTVLGSVCLCVCLIKSHLTYGASVRPENAVMYSGVNEGQKICGDLPETTAFMSYEQKSQYANFSDLPAVSFLCLTHSKARRYPTIINNIQPCPKRCLSPCWSEN